MAVIGTEGDPWFAANTTHPRVNQPSERIPFDDDAYTRRVQNGPCFICAIVAGDPDYVHPLVYESESALVFFSKYPTLFGYTLVCPREHREQSTGDFTLEEYLALQTLVYCVAEAIRAEIPTERIYVLSLGSQQGNRHVHWHIAPLPPGVPYHRQQLEALTARNGVLDPTTDEWERLAERLRARLTSVA